MKRIFSIVAISVFAFSAGFAQIPVTDIMSNMQQKISYIDTMAKWKMQYDQMINQIDQAKKQYDSLNGSRGLGTILNDPTMRNYLPSNWQSVYDQVKSGGYQGLSSRAKSIYDSNKIFDSSASIKDPDQRKAFEAKAVKASQDKAFALDGFDAAKSRINQIDQLMGRINTTQDPKAIAELQGRIAAEQANIQNEQTKLQLFQMVAAAEDKVQEQRMREIQSKAWSQRKGISVQPLTFP